MFKGIKWLFTKDAPLLIRPRFSYSQWSWIAKFLYNTAVGAYKANTVKTIKMGLEARKLYRKMIEDEGMWFDQSACGILHFYRDEKYAKAAAGVENLYEDNGVEWSLINPARIKKLEPALNTDGIISGAWTKSDWTGDIHKFCVQLAEILQRRYDVKIVYGEHHTIGSLLEMDYENIVVSAGVESVYLAGNIGESLPVYPVKGYSITINIRPGQEQMVPKVSLLDDQAKIVTSTLGNRFRVAGTAELNGENYDIRRDRIEPLLKWVHKNFPGLDTSDYTSWACLRPMTPDMLPIVKRSKKDPRVFYHTGHGHLGWTLSPATAKGLADLVNMN